MSVIVLYEFRIIVMLADEATCVVQHIRRAIYFKK